MNILAWLRKRASARRERRERPELALFNAAVARLGPGDVAIDCGANVGKFTLPLARTGATVYAFEPNPDAFAELRRATGQFPNVVLRQAAVTTAGKPVKLYLHKWAGEDPVHWSTGSSLLAGKNNVRGDRFVEVEGIAFADFVESLGDQPVSLLKMDVEGAEVAILDQLLDRGLHTRIEQAFIEMHDRRVPDLVEPSRRLRERLKAAGLDNFRLDWR
jgi:FkbM family methyltransferase